MVLFLVNLSDEDVKSVNLFESSQVISFRQFMSIVSKKPGNHLAR